MNTLLCHLNTKIVLILFAVLGLMLVGTCIDLKEISTPPESRRLRLKVLKTLSQPVINKNTPGAENIPGGFEGGNTVKVMINGKPEYHFFAHSYPKLDWSQSQLDHWVSEDGLTFRHSGVLLKNYRDEQAGVNHIFTAPIPFYDKEKSRWYLFYGEFVHGKTWTPDSGIMWCARSKTPGLKGINGPYDFPGHKTFLPGRYIPKEFVPVSNSAPFQVKDGRWAMLICPHILTEEAKAKIAGQWPVVLGFSTSPQGPFSVSEILSPPINDPVGFTENPMPIKIRGPKTGREYWVAVFDFLAPEVTSYPQKNVFGFTWSEDGMHWPKEHGQVVNVDEGLEPGEHGWWRGSSAIRTPHQMIDEGDGTYTVFFTGGTDVNHFADFRAVGMVRVKLIEE